MMNSGLRADVLEPVQVALVDVGATGAPSTIHSAVALATPAEWVTQTASATQNPLSSRCSPMIEKPSGVNEKMPLNASSTFESRKCRNEFGGRAMRARSPPR